MEMYVSEFNAIHGLWTCKCMIVPVCFGLLWELVLSLADTVSEAVVCMVGQIMEIVL